MNIIRVLVLVCVILIHSPSRAQNLSSKIKSKYPNSVVIKVFSVISKVEIPEEKQVTLANYFLKEENEIASMILASKSKNEIDNIKTKYVNDLKSILSKEEILLYENKAFINDGNLHILSSKFSDALKYKKELKLSKSQTDSVLLAGIQFEKAFYGFIPKQTGETFNTRGFENIHLPNILNEQQVIFLYSLKNRENIISTAVKDWDEAKQRNLTSDLDSQIVVNDMINYGLKRQAVSERYKREVEIRNTTLSKIDMEIPDLLAKLKKARRYGNPINSNGVVSKDGY